MKVDKNQDYSRPKKPRENEVLMLIREFAEARDDLKR